MLIDKAVETAPQTQQTENGQTESAIKPVSETAPITVDFERLQEENKDIIAWLYCPDTEINYPVVQSKDNEYYLRRLLDGTWNIAGTLFMDYRNAADCSDLHTIIYGHNMKNTRCSALCLNTVSRNITKNILFCICSHQSRIIK